MRRQRNTTSNFSATPQRHSPMEGGRGADLTELASLPQRKPVSDYRQEQEEERQQYLMRKKQHELDQQSIKTRQRCFINSQGQQICPSNNKGPFVSGKEFLHNIDTFIQEDLPAAGTGALLAGLGGVEIPLVLAGAVAATRGIDTENSGFGAGNRRRGRRI